MLRDIAYYLQLFFEATIGVFGIRPYEEPRYDVLATLSGGVEIRRYAPRLAAQIDMPGTDEQARDDAFRVLFRYIAGANATAQKVEMTVPVETKQNETSVRMQFFLPARYVAGSAPRPTDERVRIVQVAEETLAVLRFSGSAAQEDRARRTDELLKGIEAAPWRSVGDVALLFYDAPFTLPFARRNEAAVRVEPR